jgi:hypothetical protein
VLLNGSDVTQLDMLLVPHHLLNCEPDIHCEGFFQVIEHRIKEIPFPPLDTHPEESVSQVVMDLAIVA